MLIIRQFLFYSFIAVFLFFNSTVFGQRDSSHFLYPSSSLDQNKLIGLIAGETILYSSTMIGLGALWYADYPKSDFHFFNDHDEWLQMDKVGHFVTAYYLNELETGMFLWAGVGEKKAIWLSGTFGTMFLLSVEVFDGFSSGWGASYGDVVANFGGRMFGIGQTLLWEEQRVLAKFSFHDTQYAQYRPELLGNGLTEELLKDYNGQSYWLSANIASFISEESKFPDWLNIAFGYAANGMIGANENPDKINDKVLPEFERYRQYLISLDIDLNRLPVKSPILKTIFRTFGFIKIPFPAIEFNAVHGVEFHPLYF